ncbi:LuxR C-terminal-related transcriptional regulator [Streptomyces sp. NBC_01275]|uniref:LuxR C-terminal-related transcriptional regulator n=1 Tax=Streptomyces sp. NBC_01275 TaxID=2903807 RepID=UPI002254BCA6|nr:LuxR family transcriptional regulator [Streptomyces sp. NBC_01275]MCX4766694.1 LuxR C-terminal-related transcriptional regulator [Streptomyces sp. NBC_01275]
MRGWLGRWPLVGRGPELDAFAAALADRDCRGFLVSGTAGVGKSRLAEECLGRAAAAGFRVGRATASAAAGAVPLGAIAHLLPAGVDLSDPVAGFAAVAERLAAGPGGRRWALLVDDVHLLDSASAMLLRQLMDTGVILLIGTVRTGEPYGKAVAALQSGDPVYRVGLAVLGPERIEALLQAALGGPVARRTLHELTAASGGNVLYLRELVLGALTAGDLTEDGEIWHLREGRLPGTARLTEVIGARLATAASAGRPVLELLALCEPLPLADAEALAPPRVTAALEQAGLIRVAQDRRRTTVSLTHPLYGEVLRAGLPVLRRRALLLDQAARVEARGARRRGDLLRIATWRLAATGTADPALLTQAAVLARYAHDYPQTIALLQALPEKRHTTATGLMLGSAFFERGRWDQAEAVLAHTQAQAVGEQDELAVALLRTASLLWSNVPFTEALAVNDAVLERVTRPADRRKLRINEGFLRIAAGLPAQGLALLADLETEVGDAPDVNVWLRGAWMKPFGLALVGRTGEAAAWAERAHTAHRRVDEHALVSHPAVQRMPLVLALDEAGRPAEARREGRRSYAELVAADSVVRVWLAVLLGRVEWLAGHPATARRWWAEAAALARTIDHAKALRLVLGGLAACAAVLGDLAAAETTLAEHRTLPPLAPGLLSAGEERLGEAWLLAARGRLGQARSVLTAAAAAARRTGHVTGEALLLTDVARLGGAQEVSGRLAELARRCDGALAPARARLAAALAADDPDQLLEAADGCQAVGADVLTAEAATAAAAAWRRTHRPRRASAAAHRAAVALARCEGARTPLLTSAQATAALTAREREIALLAAVGNASKDIARALTLSVRTVDNHLHRAYAKLGITTRRELALTLGASAPGAHPDPRR